MKIITKMTAFTATLAVLAILIAPQLSSAENYVASPSFTGSGNMTVAQANQICMMSPNSVAAQYSFCAYGGTVPNTMVSIPDNTILISVTFPISARITWYTNVLTTSTLWYSDIPLSAMTPVQYVNSSEGYSMSHSAILTGIDLVRQHTFRVGGSTQAGAMITSGDQVI